MHSADASAQGWCQSDHERCARLGQRRERPAAGLVDWVLARLAPNGDTYVQMCAVACRFGNTATLSALVRRMPAAFATSHASTWTTLALSAGQVPVLAWLEDQGLLHAASLRDSVTSGLARLMDDLDWRCVAWVAARVPDAVDLAFIEACCMFRHSPAHDMPHPWATIAYEKRVLQDACVRVALASLR